MGILGVQVPSCTCPKISIESFKINAYHGQLQLFTGCHQHLSQTCTMLRGGAPQLAKLVQATAKTHKVSGITQLYLQLRWFTVQLRTGGVTSLCRSIYHASRVYDSCITDSQLFVQNWCRGKSTGRPNQLRVVTPGGLSGLSGLATPKKMRNRFN